MTHSDRIEFSQVRAGDLARAVATRVEHGMRFGGLVASAEQPAGGGVYALLLDQDGIHVLVAHIPPGTSTSANSGMSLPSLTRSVPAAEWYERKIHDMHGFAPDGHPHLYPLITAGAASAPSYVSGEGMFTIPYGPVRSGVFEAVEYLLETPGEEIPSLDVGIHPKHRGIESRFVGATIPDGVLLAERIEGVASVAHAMAFCQAVERICAAHVPLKAAHLRVLHAELERIANHLDVAIRLSEAAGLAVANARFGIHKERVMRFRAQLCGNRFGRGVVIPGGVEHPVSSSAGGLLSVLQGLAHDVLSDTEAALGTPSFVDRLRGTGVLDTGTAKYLGSIGPIARASGIAEDVRVDRPYASYEELGPLRPATRDSGDALGRMEVRYDELDVSFKLAAKALGEVAGLSGSHLEHLEVHDGRSIGWAEGPHGEILTLVDIEAGRVKSVLPRTASFHNLSILPRVFRGDILTDFAFIEASFGLSIAGASL